MITYHHTVLLAREFPALPLLCLLSEPSIGVTSILVAAAVHPIVCSNVVVSKPGSSFLIAQESRLY